MTPKFIKTFNEQAIETKQRLWSKSDAELNKTSNSNLFYFIRTSLTLAIIATIISTALIAVEFIRGDYPIFSSERSGAVCRDGWVSYSTGRGTCSHHGGVDYWTHPQIGFHYFNITPYLISLVCILSFLFLFSIINKAFRLRLVSFISEAAYGIGFFLYICSFIVVIPFVIIYQLVRNIVVRQLNK